MAEKLANQPNPRGFSYWFYGAIAVILTAGLAASLLVMLYALVTGAARRIHG